MVGEQLVCDGPLHLLLPVSVVRVRSMYACVFASHVLQVTDMSKSVSACAIAETGMRSEYLASAAGMGTHTNTVPQVGLG